MGKDDCWPVRLSDFSIVLTYLKLFFVACRLASKFILSVFDGRSHTCQSDTQVYERNHAQSHLRICGHDNHCRIFLYLGRPKRRSQFWWFLIRHFLRCMFALYSCFNCGLWFLPASLLLVGDLKPNGTQITDPGVQSLLYICICIVISCILYIYTLYTLVLLTTCLEEHCLKILHPTSNET